MVWGLEDIVTISLFIISIIIVLVAQGMVTSAYNKNRKKKNKRGITGCEAAQKILAQNGLSNVYVVETKGELSDHYDPSRKVVRLSREIFHGESIASLAIAAHECGHAIQDKEGYTFMRIRSALAPTVSFITYLGYFALIISIFASLTGYLYVSLFIIMAGLLFQLVTLPVEFDASKKALYQLETLGLIDSDEKPANQAMLRAAAMTYVASLVSMILSMLRILIMIRNRD